MHVDMYLDTLNNKRVTRTPLNVYLMGSFQPTYAQFSSVDATVRGRSRPTVMVPDDVH